MRALFDAMSLHAQAASGQVAVSDDNTAFTHCELLARVNGLAKRLRTEAGVVGLFAPNGAAWVVGQLACAFAGKVAVPLPTFFSDQQLGHIVRDASVGLVLATQATWPRALRSGVRTLSLNESLAEWDESTFVDGFGQVIYTSGSTGQPKGVRHASGQVAWSSAALASATQATASDRHLSVLPLSLLLETIGSVFVPRLVGAHVHFDRVASERVARGEAAGLADAFEAHRPTTSVLVPAVLKAWVGDLAASRRRAPPTLRFVAVGGAPMPPRVAADAWELGIPAHEGYGLSECCSVVSLNRVGARRAGTSGRPLDGLTISIDNGEIVVDGPTVTDGYLGQSAAGRSWRTGDLGEMDDDGFLTVLGRKDNLIVTAFGRNVSPEWVETMLLEDEKIAACVVVGHGEAHLATIIVPSSGGRIWFGYASRAEVLALIADRCAEAPAYAIPQAYVVVSPAKAAQAGLFTSNGRFVRERAARFLSSSDAFAATDDHAFTR